MFLISLISWFFSSIETIIYTLLAFIIPLYYTCKACIHLSAFPLSTLLSSSSSPSPLLEAIVPESPEAATKPVSSPIIENWLYYWCIIIFFHLSTGLYERTLMPLLAGSSLLYRLSKLTIVAWLGVSSPDGRVARSWWDGFVGPLLIKYEVEIDALVRQTLSILDSVKDFFIANLNSIIKSSNIVLTKSSGMICSSDIKVASVNLTPIESNEI